MSSDSDVDEDELLQIALREQAQRDGNYHKTHRPSKPVVNHLQPPPPTHVTRKNPNSGRRTAQNDDSEVEMLSISSEDEESPSKEEKTRGRQQGRKANSDDRECAAGEEPRRWKQVDEAALARRVRDMRVTRTAPVIPRSDQMAASAVPRKALGTVPSFHRGVEFPDPLGLGIIDSNSLRLMTDTSDDQATDLSDADLRLKLRYFSEKFDPKLFLSRIHHGTSADDLEDGSLALRAGFEGRTRQKKMLVKENFDCFVSCKTTIDDIQSKLRLIEEDPEGAGTSHLLDSIQGISSLANRAFQPMFERQAQAEKIRSVQGMLQRFRTLFNLPSTIRESIVKGELDLAVREYRKAKSIDLPSHVGILKRVLEEVEKVMKEFKSMLYKSMKDPLVSMAALENSVRLLLELEPESDPVWYYLQIQNSRIEAYLNKCTADHDSRMAALKKKTNEYLQSEKRWRQLRRHPPEYTPEHDVSPPPSAGEEDALRRMYICLLTDVITKHVPSFLKIAASVFAGKFVKSSSDQKISAKKCSNHSIDEVYSMIRKTISMYGKKVRDSFGEFEESNVVLLPFMSDAVKELSVACRAFGSNETETPSSAALQVLYCEIARMYVFKLCSWMRSSVDDVSKNESCIPVTILERNRSPYRISNLPLSFKSVVSSAMDRIDLTLQSLFQIVRSEEAISELQDIQESTRLAFFNCFLDFSVNLERLAGDPISSNEEDGTTDDPDLSTSSLHRRLLVVLSNIGFCKDELSHELYNRYKRTWIRRGEEDDTSDIGDLVLSFASLETKALEQYTFQKASLIRTAATNYVVNSGARVAAAAVTGVRDVAVEMLHTFVAVHAEVFAGAKHLLDRTIGILVEALIDTFLGVLNENEDLKSLDVNGFCQLMLELEYFDTVLNQYFTPEARESMKSLQELLLEKTTESMSDAVGKIGHRRRATKGSEDSLGDEKQQGAAAAAALTADDLVVLAQQCVAELLQADLERTRVNTACFFVQQQRSSSSDSPPLYTSSAQGVPTDSLQNRSRRSRTAGVGSPMSFRHRPS